MTYTHIMVPIDLEHAERMVKATDTARALAKLFGAKLTFVGVTSEVPGPAAHNPAEFEKKMDEFCPTKRGGPSGGGGFKNLCRP